MGTSDTPSRPYSPVPNPASQPIRLAGSVLHEHRHVCAFLGSHDDEYRVMLPFIEDGIDCGHRPDELLEELRTGRAAAV